MALTFSVVDTWDDGKRIHVSATVAATGNYTTSGDTLDLFQVPLIAGERLYLSDILVGRFGRLTLRKIEALSKDSQKVTASCEPVRQFYAARHAASVLTHNYTFSS